MPARVNHDLDPIEPRPAQEVYLDHKASHCSAKTDRSHRYRTNFFVQWCQEIGIDNLNDLTGRHLHEYRLWREDHGDLKPVTLQGQMSTIRVLMKWCGSIEAVDPDLYTKVMVPRVDPGVRASDGGSVEFVRGVHCGTSGP